MRYFLWRNQIENVCQYWDSIVYLLLGVLFLTGVAVAFV